MESPVTPPASDVDPVVSPTAPAGPELAASPAAAEGAAPAGAPKRAAPPKPCLGVLLVHGAGDHGTGSTLIEFGESLVRWLDGWFRHGATTGGSTGEGAVTGVTQILVREGDKHAPAHSKVRLRSARGEEHTWLLAESHWDNAFTPPDFRQVLGWAVGVVPWFLLTQFIGPLARRAQLVAPTPIGVAGYLWRVVVGATAALLASAFIFGLAVVIVVLSVIPSDTVRGIAGGLQRFASTGVGDLYMVLNSPIQRAALTGAVQRDIDWLRQQGCDRVALIAHSQGGYVSYQALTDPWCRTIELFVTFGSALVRISEADRASRTSALRLALIGTFGALLAIRFLPAALLGEAGIWEKRQADGLAFTVGVLLSGLLIVVLWRYFHVASRIANLPTPIRWLDFLTTEDPVMNRRREKILPWRVEKIRTQNRGSRLSDHGSYWLNSDEFVPQVAMAVAGLDPELNLALEGPVPASTQTLLDDAYSLRHRRVAALRLHGSTVIAATIATIAFLLYRGGELDAIGVRVGQWFDGLPDFVKTLVPDVARSILPIDGIETVVVGGAVIALASGIGLWIGSRIWTSWSASATTDELSRRDRLAEAGGGPVSPAPPGILFYLWTLVHLLILGLIAIVGPIALMDQFGRYADQRDVIVQAWARQYIATAAVGVAAWLWVRPPRRIEPDAHWRVVGGLVLALVAELWIAILVPGPTEWTVAIPLGFGIGFVSIVAAWLIWPVLRWLLMQVVAVVEQDREPEGVLAHPATVIDYLGFVGLMVASIAAALVVVPASFTSTPDQLQHRWWFTALLGLAGALCGFVLAINTRGFWWLSDLAAPRVAKAMPSLPRIRPARARFRRMTRKSSTVMRLVGWVAVVIGLAAFAVAASRYLAG